MNLANLDNIVTSLTAARRWQEAAKVL